jgi:transcriptional regulator with XRE-family HTH domain
MSTQNKTKSRDFDAEIILGPDATIGDKLKALRLSKKMTLTALARASGLSDRAIRYIENNERQPSVDAIKKLSAALEVGTDYFMDDAAFAEESDTETFLAQAKEKYGSRGKAQAASILNQAASLYAGEELSEEDKKMFRNEMMAIFWDSKERAKKFTPKKYRKE